MGLWRTCVEFHFLVLSTSIDNTHSSNQRGGVGAMPRDWHHEAIRLVWPGCEAENNCQHMNTCGG